MTEPQKSIRPKAVPKKKVSKKRKAKKLTDEQKAQRLQEREIRNLMSNIGFKKFPRIDGKEFVYKDRTSEMDDIFYFENILLITEYTIGSPGKHLLEGSLSLLPASPPTPIYYHQKWSG